MKIRKIPMRTCVVTKEKCEKKDLIRVVRNKDNGVSVDLTGKMNGRGAYLKKDLLVIEKAQNTKILEKILEVSIPDNIYVETDKEEKLDELKSLVK